MEYLKILKYAIILEFLINIDSNIYYNEYLIKLVKSLIPINKNYAYLLELNKEELKKELNKIIIEVYK